MNRRFLRVFSLILISLGMSSTVLASSETVEKGAIPNVPAGWDHLFREMLIDITVIGVIFAGVTLYMLIRYRRKYPGQNGSPVKLSRAAALVWAIIPVFVFMADDFYLAAESWSLWNDYRRVPENAYEINVEGAMWSWHFTYPEGVETYNELRVPAGTPVVVRMTSKDVVHSFFLPEFRVKEDLMPGRITYLWFYPEKPGEYLITCAEYCGVMHSGMRGTIIAMPEDEFQSWLEKEKASMEGGV